jgi:CubicO group peptidase (beta-lactamase class C family)
MIKISTTLFVFLLGICISFAQIKQGYEDLDVAITKGVELFEMPGIAIGIVKNGEVVFSKAYGFANSETKKVVDPETIFGIASCSKAFTAACLGILVDEGELAWSDRVIDYFPEFKLFDPYITREMQIQDLLSHRSGLQTFDGDLLWYGTNYTREEVVNRIQYRENSYSFRSRFGYQNVMYIAAGEVIRKVSGMSWDDFVKQRIFDPLGMSRTNTSNQEFKPDMNIAWPHLNGKPMEFINYDNCGPAASINSSVSDLLKWVELLLNKGTYRNKEILSSEQYYKLVTPLTMLNAGSGETIGGTHFYGYGMGWFLYDYEGRKVVQHGGGLPGFHSKVVLIPEDSLGYVIIANQLSGLVEAIYNTIRDYHITDSDHDWIREYHDQEQKRNAIKESKENEKQDARVTGTNPSLPVENYTGTYVDSMYGIASVSMNDGVLSLSLLPTRELFTGNLEHWHYNTFRVRFKDPFLPPGYVTFEINGDARVASFTIDLDNPDFHFHKLNFIKE